MKRLLTLLPLILLTSFLTACSGFFDKDNTPPPSPLVSFQPQIKVQKHWQTHPNNGVGKDDLRLPPAVTEQAIFTASKDGVVSANDKTSGKSLWRTHAGLLISGGPTAGEDLVFVGSREGEV